LVRTYQSSTLSDEEIRLCLYSLGDHNSFLASDRDPVDRMIRLLTTHFYPELPNANRNKERKTVLDLKDQTHSGEEDGQSTEDDDLEDDINSLAISTGKRGARLTHNHTRQYHYVLQSLTLWREVASEMFRLWVLADEDLLDDKHPYRLTDTGQGLHRVQAAPRVSRAMQQILYRTQQKVGAQHWVGSSVIHLGDANVPNALMFIDKYTQVARILGPITITLDRLPQMVENDERVKHYVDETFGGVVRLTKLVLSDFFRHAFDGSGADNFFDAGSCIDGRLTSAWNWCSRLETKPFYPIFKLAGFLGFDGNFQK